MMETTRIKEDMRPPEHGPRILFFSGGTALRGLSQALVRHTHNSMHIITPFDSGGSSAVLRKAFAMPAVGDIRNRLVALADLSVPGIQEIFALFTYRLSKNDHQGVLVDELKRMAGGEHILIDLVPEPNRSVIRDHFHRFLDIMPEDFDLRGASIGNLVLSAGYFDHAQRLGPVIDQFSELAQVRGIVRPVVDENLHLAAELEDGTVVVGQHHMTGKESSPLTSKIKRVWLTDSLDAVEEAESMIDGQVGNLIRDAELICFPIGSFYTSVVANLLPRGVGAAVAANSCPKIFVPNPGIDPELLGHTVEEQVELLRRYLVASGAPDESNLLHHVVVDSRAEYSGGLNKAAITRLGVDIIDVPLVSDESTPLFAPDLLANLLVSLVE